MIIRFLEFIKEDVEKTDKSDIDYEKNVLVLIDFINDYVRNIKNSKTTEELNLNLRIFTGNFKKIDHKVTYFIRPVDKKLVKRWYDYRERMYNHILNILNTLKKEKDLVPSNEDYSLFNFSFKKMLNKKYFDLDL